MDVVWSPSAVRQVQRIFEYLAELNPRAAEQVSFQLKSAGESLRYFPYRGRPVPGSAMRELVTVYPYVIRFQIGRKAVLIVRVRHASRRPTFP